MNIKELTKNYDYLLFDFDGTLVDTGDGIINATHYALLQYGIDETDEANLRRFVGPPLTKAFSKYYGFSEEDATQAVLEFRKYYVTFGWKESHIYPHITEMLEDLKRSGKHLCVATGKPEDLAVTIAERDGILNYFDFIGGAYVDSEGEHRVMKPEVINYVLDSVNATDRSKVVMIGDRANDIEGAKACGLASIGVLWGYGSFDELNNSGADFFADSPI